MKNIVGLKTDKELGCWTNIVEMITLTRDASVRVTFQMALNQMVMFWEAALDIWLIL